MNNQITKWSNEITKHLETDERIKSIWLFGSRITGKKGSHKGGGLPDDDSDLDVGIVGDCFDDDYNHFCDLTSYDIKEIKSVLQNALGIKVDIQIAHKFDTRTWPNISKANWLIYERESNPSNQL